MNSTRPGISSRRAESSLAAAASIAVCVSCPQACMRSSAVELKSSPVSSCSGSASMSPRSSTVGPGLPPVSSAATPRRRLVQRDIEGQAVERLEHHVTGCREVVADLRVPVQTAAQPHRFVMEIPGLVAERVERHAEMVCRAMVARQRAGSMRRTGRTRRRRRHVIEIVPRGRMRRENLRHRSVAVIVISSRGRAPGSSPRRRQGRVPGMVGSRRRRRGRGRRDLRRRGAHVSWPRSWASASPTGVRDVGPTTTTRTPTRSATCSASCTTVRFGSTTARSPRPASSHRQSLAQLRRAASASCQGACA